MASSRMPWIIGCVVAIAAFEIGAWWTASRPEYQHVWANIAWVAVDVFALVMCWRAARRAKPHARRSWWCVTITMMCLTAGMLAWAFNELVLGRLTPFPSITDVLAWIGAPFLIAGIFFFKAPGSSRALGLQHLADLALTVAAMVSLTIAILYVPAITATYPTTYIASAVMSPILCVTAAAFGLLTLWQHVGGPRRRVLAVLWFALFLLGVAVVVYAEALLAGRYSAGQFLDLLWVLAFLAFATAAREELRLGDDVEEEVSPQRANHFAPLVPTVALAVWMIAWLSSSDRDALLAINAVTGGLLAVALFVRVWATQQLEASLAARVASEEARAWQLEARLARVHKLEALGTLAGGIAHDFNNVLGAATAALKLARRKLTRGASVARDLDEIDGVLWRAADLTSRLLDLARKREPKPVAINPRDAIERVCVLLEKVVPANVKIAIECPVSLPAVNVDPSGLEHALLNLGLNARDAVRDRGGTISMRARVAAESVEFEVADDGTGIPADLLPRLFEPFFTTKSDQGTGLGLAMVEAFTNANGGTVSVTSEPGRTRFSLAFPAVTTVAPATTLPAPTATVLVVSREDAAGLATAGVLSRGGIAATVAHDATTALAECARLSRVDAVIVDGATGVAGRDTLRALRDAGVVASSVLLAAPGSDDTGEWTAVVSKPYDPLGLVEEVHRVIAKRVADANPPR
jgi:signal transduction histidine kinase